MTCFCQRPCVKAFFNLSLTIVELKYQTNSPNQLFINHFFIFHFFILSPLYGDNLYVKDALFCVLFYSTH